MKKGGKRGGGGGANGSEENQQLRNKYEIKVHKEGNDAPHATDPPPQVTIRRLGRSPGQRPDLARGLWR